METFVIVFGSLVIGIPLLCIIWLIAVKVYMAIDEIRLSHNTNKTELFCSQPFFIDLFERLSFALNYGKCNNIDLLLFALFKARLCAIMCIAESKLPEENKKRAINAYDTYMYLSIGEWFDKNAAGIDKTTIIDNRMSAYDSTMLHFKNNPLCMSMLSSALFWFLTDGWEKDSDGCFTLSPNLSYNICSLKECARDVESKFCTVQEDIDNVVFGYCQREIPKLVLHLSK